MNIKNNYNKKEEKEEKKKMIYIWSNNNDKRIVKNKIALFSHREYPVLYVIRFFCN